MCGHPPTRKRTDFAHSKTSCLFATSDLKVNVSTIHSHGNDASSLGTRGESGSRALDVGPPLHLTASKSTPHQTDCPRVMGSYLNTGVIVLVSNREALTEVTLFW